MSVEEIKKNAEEEVRFYKLLNLIFMLCDIAGFKLKGRITLVDKETGRVFK